MTTKNNNEYGNRTWSSYVPKALNSCPSHVIENIDKKPNNIKAIVKKALIQINVKRLSSM